MANINTPTQSLRTPTKADHKPFSWLAAELHMNTSAQFMATTLDISRGIQTCLSLVCASDLAREQRDDSCPPPLNVADTENLARMAMAAAGMLSERAEGYIDVLNDMHANAEKRKPGM